jgi:DNA-binding MarR family transcriptional regulator
MSRSQGDDPGLFRFFNEVGIIAQLSQRMFENVMPAGMTLAQFSILNHFVRLGGERSPAQLADAFQLTRATMTSTLGRLSDKGLVAIAPDPEDGRGKRVTITEAGRRMREACVTALGPEIERLDGLIDGESISLLVQHLSGIRKVLDSDRDSGPAASA